MRTIDNLRNEFDGVIFVYLKDDATAKKFLEMAEKEGYMFGNQKPTESNLDDIISVKENKKIAHVGATGRIAFQTNGGDDSEGKFHRIDFYKYINGESDYIYR